MYNLNIAENIVKLRHDKKITQEQLAEFIGVTKASVSKWENGQSTPDIVILPQLATFFDVTVDQLIGYTPLLSKEQIQKLYQRFAKDFAERPFEEVMAETQDYVKRYYSCYGFLLQICTLWLNHGRLADSKERQQEIYQQILKLCVRIKENCKDIKIYGKAVVIQATACFQTGNFKDIMDELEEFSDSSNYRIQSSVLLIQAFAMQGDIEKAVSYSQINMYGNIMWLLTNATYYLMVNAENLVVCEETIQRIEKVADIYKIKELNPNILLSFEFQSALYYIRHNDTTKAMEHINQYVACLKQLFSTEEICLHGDSYFNKVEKWFDDEFDNGTNAPRDRKVILEDARNTLDSPLFDALNGFPEFENARKKVKELK